MSQNVERNNWPEWVNPESSLEAFRQSPEFQGSVEPADHDHTNDHFALIYNTKDELFASAVPFLRQGLEQDEQCLYVVDERSEEKLEIIEALRAGGIDVDEARKSGALVFYTVAETYLRTEPFDPEAMISFYADAINDALTEYEGLRVVAGTNWIEDVSLEAFMEYEGRVNTLFEETDSMALCHYDRTYLPADVIHDVIQTHPHLIYDDTICHNFYYTPPEELFGPDERGNKVDRMLGTLRDRAQAKTEVAEHKQFLHELTEITSSPDLSFEEKLQHLFDLGCEWFELELGALNRVDRDEDQLQVEYINGDHEYYTPGAEFPLSQTYCMAAADIKAAASVSDPREEGFDDLAVYEEFGVETYLGTYIPVTGGVDRTFAFIASGPRQEPFSEEDRAYLELMSQWVKYELNRKRREDRLGTLNTLSRALMGAKTQTEIADTTVRHAQEALHLPVTALVEYDRQQGTLSPAARTSRAVDELPTAVLCDQQSGPLWNAFVANEVKTVDDVGSIAGAGDDLTEMIAVPLEQQGVFVTATSASEGFSDAEFNFVETVAATVKAACTRADREQKLHEREETLEAQNKTLQRLDRINTTIRNIDQALVQASTRKEIETAVCEHLANVGPYELAWIGEHDPATDKIVPEEWAGAERGYLEKITVTADDGPLGRGPGGQAVETRELQVINNILTDESFEPWRQAALNRGYHASIALPLVYDDTLYGILGVYAGQPEVFDDLERTVLTELADTVAYAINAVESKKSLVSDTATELEFEVQDMGHPLVALTETTDCEMELESLAPQPDGGLHAFITTRGVSANEVIDAHGPDVATDLTVLSEHDEEDGPTCLFDVALDADSISQTALEHGGVVRVITAADGTARFILELATDIDTREFVETIRTKYPETELVAHRTTERSPQTRLGFYDRLLDTLTARQLQVLQTAYVGGYFEEPRAQTASDLADTMEISQPTFTSHLRAAHRKVCRQLFEDNNVVASAAKRDNANK